MTHTKLIAGAVIAVAAAYGATTAYVGHRVNQELVALGATLTAHDDVVVTRFDYERSFASGVLHYDLTWRPLEIDAAVALLHEAGLLPDEGLRLKGTKRLRHGPWTGRETGFALASSVGDIALPDPARPFLPQYPGQAPLMHLTGLITYRGHLEARARLIDYDGRIAIPEFDGGVRLGLAGLEGRLRVSPALDRVDSDLRLDALSLAVHEPGESIELELAGLEFVLDLLEERPHVWTGITQTRLAAVSMRAPEHRLAMTGVAAESEAWIDGPMLHSRSSLALGPSSLDEYALLGASLLLSLRNLDVEAVAALAALAQESAAGAIEAEEFEEALARIEAFGTQLERILAGGPILAVERLSLALGAADDITGRLQVALLPGTVVSLDDPEALARALTADAELAASMAALRFIAALMVAEDLPADADAAEREARTTAMTGELLAGLQLLPFVQVDDRQVSISAQLAGGTLFVGGEEIMDAGMLLGLALAGIGGERSRDPGPRDARPDLGIPEGADYIDPDAEPLYGLVELAAGFVPDPMAIELLAGGGDDLELLVGEGCVGWVNGVRPDVVLRFEAGAAPLYIYASADEDTTLAVRAPDGRWHCNDDALGRGFDPGIEFVAPESGDYAIWVGTYLPGLVEAVLLVSEVGMED